MYNFIEYSEQNLKTATSYISTDLLKSINTNNVMINYTDISTFTDTELQLHLINATQILDNLMSFKGSKQNVEQRLEFPRDFEEDFIIADDIKLATAYISAKIGNGQLSDIIVEESGIQVKKEKADVLEKEYFEAISSKTAVFATNPYLENLLYDFISGNGSLFITTNKG